MALDVGGLECWVGEATGASYWQARLRRAQAVVDVTVTWRSSRTSPARVTLLVRRALGPPPFAVDGGAVPADAARVEVPGADEAAGTDVDTSSEEEEAPAPGVGTAGDAADVKGGAVGTAPAATAARAPAAPHGWLVVASATVGIDARKTVLQAPLGLRPAARALRLVLEPRNAAARTGGEGAEAQGWRTDDEGEGEGEGERGNDDVIVRQRHAIANVKGRGLWV